MCNVCEFSMVFESVVIFILKVVVIFLVLILVFEWVVGMCVLWKIIL